MSITALTCLLLLPSCSDTPVQQQQTTATVRDSAGVTITENSASLLEGSPITVLDSPAVTIGAVDGDENDMLHEVRGVRLLSDGSILVLNGGTHQIRHYDASGRWAASHSRKGSGPGEMQHPMMMVSARGDSSWILDISTRRLNLVAADGRIVDEVSFRNTLSGFAGMVDARTAVTAEPVRQRGIFDQVLEMKVPVVVSDLETGTGDTLEVLDGPRSYSYTNGDLVRTLIIPHSGTPFVEVRDDEIFSADGTRPEVRVFGRDGKLRRIIRVGLPPSPITDDEWESTIGDMLDGNSSSVGEARLGAAEVARQKRIYAEMARPTVRPYFTAMVVSQSGDVWVRPASPAGHPVRWIVFDAAGNIARRVALPRSFLPLQVSQDRVLGRSWDDLGVEYVVVYELNRAN